MIYYLLGTKQSVKSMLNFLFLSSYCLIFGLGAYAQQVELVTGLSTAINETSGLLYLNQKIITHNDSGGQPELYEIDSIAGGINRTVVLQNASNIDWEDITADADYIYIGDFGNNTGARTNLKIYRLPQQDFFNSSLASVLVDTIVFNYADQIDFTPTNYTTNFDAEALVAFNDSLYIFTKNWGDNWTNIYALPKTPGNYQLEKHDSINTMGLVTGASVSQDGSSIVLCGYAGITPFITELNQISDSDFSGSNISRYTIVQPTGYSVQIEGITVINESQFYLSSEKFLTGTLSGLYKLTFDDFLNINSKEEPEIKVFPNPTCNYFTIQSNKSERMEVVNELGQVLRTIQLLSGENEVRIDDLSKGTYVLRFSDLQITKKITIF